MATSGGTTALHAALAALGIGTGDTVVTTPSSFVATANAVRHVGTRPLLTDIDPVTYDLHLERVVVSPRTPTASTPSRPSVSTAVPRQ